MAIGQQGIFEYVDEQTAQLQKEHVELLQTLRSQPQVTNIYLVIVADVSGIGDREQLYVNLPNSEVITVDRTSIKVMQGNQVRWNGTFAEGSAYVRLLIAKLGITGMIRAGKYNYDLHPLRDTGLHVLTGIDPSGFEREDPPLMIDGNNDSESYGNNIFDSGESTILSNPEIRVMVVYTSNAKNNYSGDINQLITFVVGNMEDAFTTSGVNADINLVHTAEISYNESTNSTLNLCRLTMSLTFDPREDSLSDACDSFSTATISGHMNQIHEWRYSYNAHLVVLITGSGGEGIAWMPSVNANYAFSIARYDVAASNYTLAHEIGHNLGADHDPDSAVGPVYPYGHGYIYHPLNWTTILAYPPKGYSRINRYSTPLKTYAGVPTGTSALHDNARAMNNRVNLVANFSPPAPPLSPPNLSINTSGFNPVLNWNSVSGASSYNIYRGNVQGAPGTVTCSHVQNFTQIQSTTSTSFTDFSVMIDPFEHILICYYVTYVNQDGESNPSNKVGTHGMAPFSTTPDDDNEITTRNETPASFDLKPNYPNPFNPSTTIAYDLPEQSDVLLQVFDVMGRRVATLEASTQSADSYHVSFDASNLSSGIYIVRLKATGISGNSFVRENKMQLVK